MESLGEIKSVRFSDGMLNKIELVVLNSSGKYSNMNHFVRVAVIKLLREEGIK